MAYSAYKKYVEDPDCYDRRFESKKKKYGTKLHVRRDFLIRMKNRMCYYIVHAIYMCPNEYVLHACSAPSNLKARSCVDTMLVRASSLARHTIELVAAQKIYSMVAKVNGGQFNNHSNSIRHL